jgi:hypothetical protein
MKQQIFSIFDSKAEAYLAPFFLHKAAMAERAFRQMVNQEGHQFEASPADYTLFHIGEYDDQNASITPCVPKALFNGVELKAARPQLSEVQSA